MYLLNKYLSICKFVFPNLNIIALRVMMTLKLENIHHICFVLG